MGSRHLLNDGDPGEAADADPVELSVAVLEGLRTDGGGSPGPAVLRAVDPAAIDGDQARIAFWVNTYNSLLRSITAARPFRRSVLLSLRAFGTYRFEIGGHPYTLDLIEHGVLRGNARPPVGVRPPLRDSDPRLASLPSAPDPRVHFALNCGARSCPPIRAYRAASVDSELERATVDYLGAESDVDDEAGSVELPGLMKLYGADFGGTAGRLHFAAKRLPDLERLLSREPNPKVRYARFDWHVAG